MLVTRVILIWVLLELRCMADSTTKENEFEKLSERADSSPGSPLPVVHLQNEEVAKPLPNTRKESKLPSERTGKPTTYPFIENIVQRTVDRYMHVIRTQRDWLQRLLQLVREERAIRSKYNCSTDACIYKIQLFTHHLPPSLFHAEPNAVTHRKRVRRSVAHPEPVEPQLPEKQALGSHTEANHMGGEQSTKPKQLEHEETSNPTNLVIHGDDDALRVPERFESSLSQNDSHKSDTGIGMLEGAGPHPQVSHFEDAGKINMERMSQEVLTEALSRKNKPTSTRKHPDVLDSKVETTTLSIPDGDSIVLDIVTNETDIHTNEHVSVPASAPTFPSHSIEETELPDSVLESLSDDSTTDVSSDESGEALDDAFDAGAIELLENPQLLEPVVEVEMSIPAIPFGLNKFGGQPYENCTGRFENYCYNALKCVYISVLETAACYCRTGYTGVRCDMFNLPQTLDILKSFREEAVDIPSLRQPNALTLYNVVEATARYTVNAVLEEDLLSRWNDDSLR